MKIISKICSGVLLSTLALIYCATQSPIDAEQEGAWSLYAMNHLMGDSTNFKSRFLKKNYSEFLSMELKVLSKDTLSNKNIVMVYVLLDDTGTMLPVNFLTFYAVEIDPDNALISMFFDDYGKIDMQVGNSVCDSLFFKILSDNKALKLSESLSNAYNHYKDSRRSKSNIVNQ